MKAKSAGSFVELPKCLVLLGLCCLVPLLMGGCTEFRTDVVSVFETATRSALLSTDDEWTIANAARVSLVDSTINLIFDQLLPNQP
jgi:hypothetical protein